MRFLIRTNLKQVKRHNDIYVCMVSFAHSVASAGKYIAIVSTTVETANPIAELGPGISLIGEIMERWVFDKFLNHNCA